jgi:hypothetical protein
MPTEPSTTFVTRSAREFLALFFFGLVTNNTPYEFAALHTRQQSPAAEALEDNDDGDGFVGLERSMGRVDDHPREHAVTRVTRSSVNDVDPRPTSDEVTFLLVAAPIEQGRRRKH